MNGVEVSKVDVGSLESFLRSRELTFVDDAATNVKLAIYLRYVSAEIRGGADSYTCETCNAKIAGPLQNCPVCGEETGIEIVAEGVEAKPLTVRDLDDTVRKIRAAAVSLATNYYRIGCELTLVLESKLYRTRLDPKTKKPIHRSFDAFCQAELGLKPQTARNMVAVAGAFDQETISRFGISKLTFLVKVPEDERENALKHADGMSKSQVRDYVAKLFPGARRPALPGSKPIAPSAGRKGRNPGVPSATPTPKKDRVTVASVPNEPVTVKLERKKVAGKQVLLGVEPALNGVRIDYEIDPAKMTLIVRRVRE